MVVVILTVVIAVAVSVAAAAAALAADDRSTGHRHVPTLTPVASAWLPPQVPVETARSG